MVKIYMVHTAKGKKYVAEKEKNMLQKNWPENL